MQNGLRDSCSRCDLGFHEFIPDQRLRQRKLLSRKYLLQNAPTACLDRLEFCISAFPSKPSSDLRILVRQEQGQTSGRSCCGQVINYIRLEQDQAKR